MLEKGQPQGQWIEAAGSYVVNQNDVARRFAHFPAIKEQMFGMHPVPHYLFACDGIALGTLIFMVWKAQVYPTGMDIDCVAE